MANENGHMSSGDWSSPSMRDAVEQVDLPKRLPRIGLVLGSLGIKAFAAMPLLQLLSRLKVPVEYIVGCSGGAFMAALWSAGFDLKQIQKVFMSNFFRDVCMQVDTNTLSRMTDKKDILGSFNMASGLYRPRGLRKAYEIIFKDIRLENLKPKTVLYATDIVSGEGITLDSGLAWQAALASSSLYPLMPPVKIGDRYLADGSYNSPLPILEAIKENTDIIVAVFFQDQINPMPSNFLDCFMNTVSISSRSLLQSQMIGSIMMHHYEIILVQVRFERHVELWEVEKVPEILHAGKIAAHDHLPQLIDAFKQFGKAPSDGRMG